MTLAARPSGMLDLARLSLLPLRRFIEEEFDGEAAGLLFAGSALHADLTPETSGSALFALSVLVYFVRVSWARSPRNCPSSDNDTVPR